MKLTTLYGVLLPLALILLQACCTGKANSSYRTNGNVPDLSTDMISNPPTGSTVYRNDISIRAVRHFSQTYPDVQDERWYVINHGFMAKCRKNDITIRIDYDRKGSWLYTIRYLRERQLPIEVRRLVRSNWLDHEISSAEEIQVNTEYIYLVHIREGSDWKIIRVYNGEVNEMPLTNKAG